MGKPHMESLSKLAHTHPAAANVLCSNDKFCKNTSNPMTEQVSNISGLCEGALPKERISVNCISH